MEEILFYITCNVCVCVCVHNLQWIQGIRQASTDTVLLWVSYVYGTLSHSAYPLMATVVPEGRGVFSRIKCHTAQNNSGMSWGLWPRSAPLRLIPQDSFRAAMEVRAVLATRKWRKLHNTGRVALMLRLSSTSPHSRVCTPTYEHNIVHKLKATWQLFSLESMSFFKAIYIYPLCMEAPFFKAVE